MKRFSALRERGRPQEVKENINSESTKLHASVGVDSVIDKIHNAGIRDKQDEVNR